ncbi:MAG: type II toxin-antitoxin system VapC family toxin [archaeon]|nr:type II toxin-antitoxin system VapC family toxin [archaeon]
MLIDANIFLELLLEQKNSDRCRTFLNKTANGEVSAVVSDFTIDSVILVMSNHGGDNKKIREFINKIINSKGIRIYSVSMRDRLEALNVMGKYNLDYEDAIVLQSALSTKSKEIMSFDRHFDKVSAVKRVEPN